LSIVPFVLRRIVSVSGAKVSEFSEMSPKSKTTVGFVARRALAVSTSAQNSRYSPRVRSMPAGPSTDRMERNRGPGVVFRLVQAPRRRLKATRLRHRQQREPQHRFGGFDARAEQRGERIDLLAREGRLPAAHGAAVRLPHERARVILLEEQRAELAADERFT